jgi:serine/threonine protein kinase
MTDPVCASVWLSVCARALSAKELISALLVTEPSRRLSAAQALRHSWISTTLDTMQPLALTRQNMRRHLRNKFKARGRHVEAGCDP